MYIRKPVPQDVIDFITEGNAFVIAGHKEPDGDCAGSQLALAELLKLLGKRCCLLSAGPWKRAEIMPYKERFLDNAETLNREGLRLIIADCSSFERIGEDLSKALEDLPVCFIDHHKTNTVSSPCYINPEAPATASLVLALWEAFGKPLSKEAAGYLLLSLCTDTGFFRHIDEGGAQTMEDARTLVAAGGSPKETFALINGGKTLSSRKLLGTVLSRAEGYYGGRLIVSSENLSETELYGRENRDSDMLYQLLQSVEGAEAVAIIRQDDNENCAVGLRSKDAVDVSAIAQQLGGGGHKNASGALAAGKIPEVKDKVIELFKLCFN